MGNYIVRIYRFQKDNRRHLVGIVEPVEDARRRKWAFTNIDDLWEILSSQISERVFPQQWGAAKEVKASTPANPVDVLKGPISKVIVDARRLSREERVLLAGYTIKKVGIGEIVALADDDDAREDISQAARNQGWMISGVESRNDTYRITIIPAPCTTKGA
jgi:hypothetical protein